MNALHQNDEVCVVQVGDTSRDVQIFEGNDPLIVGEEAWEERIDPKRGGVYNHLASSQTG